MSPPPEWRGPAPKGRPDAPTTAATTIKAKNTRHAPAPTDASNDIHGHVLDFVSDLDRAYFEAHPGVASYQRPAEEHEFCDPRSYPRCVLPFPTPPQLGNRPLKPMVSVTEISPGLRTRGPWWAMTS